MTLKKFKGYHKADATKQIGSNTCGDFDFVNVG